MHKKHYLLLLTLCHTIFTLSKPEYEIKRKKDGRLVIIHNQQHTSADNKEFTLSPNINKIPEGYRIEQETHSDLFKRVWYKHRKQLTQNGVAIIIFLSLKLAANKKSTQENQNSPPNTGNTVLALPWYDDQIIPNNGENLPNQDFENNIPFDEIAHSAFIIFSSKQLKELYFLCVELFEGRQPKLVKTDDSVIHDTKEK